MRARSAKLLSLSLALPLITILPVAGQRER